MSDVRWTCELLDRLSQKQLLDAFRAAGCEPSVAERYVQLLRAEVDRGLKGQWLQLKGRVRERWGKLTNDDLDVIQGNTEQLAGKIQERYGLAREEARRAVDAWLREERVTT